MMTKRKIAVLSALLGAASLCYGQHSKVSPDLESRDPEAPVNVIIQYKQTPRQSHIDAVVSKGGRHLRTLDVVHGAVFSVPAKALADLASDPDVKYISPDRAVRATSAYSQLQSDYKLQAVGANVAQQNGYNGAGIGVAIIDSGISNRPDFHGVNSGYSSASTNASFGNTGGFRVVYAENILNPGGSTDDVY